MTPLEAFTIVKDFLDDMRDGTCKSVPMRYTDSYIYLEQNCYPQIEAALKELEGIKNCSVPKYQYEQDLKKLKALEIIKEKPIVALVDYKYTYEEWLEIVDEKDKDLFKNKEEYDLLKEVLL